MFVPGRSRSIETEFDENDDIFDGATLVQVEAKTTDTVIETYVDEFGFKTQVIYELESVLHYAGMTVTREPQFFPFSRQHIALSAIEDVKLNDEKVVAIDFPCIGAENFTKKYDTNVTFNMEQGVKVVKTNDYFVSSVQPMDPKDPEAVVFQVLTESGFTKCYLWDDAQVKEVKVPYPMYLRRRGQYYLNYTSMYGDDIIVPCRHRYVGLNSNSSYYLWVDGVPLYLPRFHTAVLSCDGSYVRDSGGNLYFPYYERGNYICDLDNKEVIIETSRPPDSAQSIKTMLESTWTTFEFIAKHPFLIHEAEVYGRVDCKIIHDVDTLYRGFQIKQKGNKRAEDMARVRFSYPNTDFYFILIYLRKHYIGNLEYDGYLGSQVLGSIMQYKGVHWTRSRIIDAEKLMIKRNKKGIPHGVWYKLPKN